MGFRYSDPNKWHDDWYLGLSPKMKCAWLYICDNCDGCGLLKVSFRKLSYDVGEPITRDEFTTAFGERLAAISEDSFWVAGYIQFQHKRLSAKNAANLNMIKKVLGVVGHTHPTPRVQAALNFLLEALKDAPGAGLSDLPKLHSVPREQAVTPIESSGEPVYRDGKPEYKIQIEIESSSSDFSSGGSGGDFKPPPLSSLPPPPPPPRPLHPPSAIRSVKELRRKIPIVRMEFWKQRYDAPGFLDQALEDAFRWHTSEECSTPRTDGQWIKKLETWLKNEWEAQNRKRSYSREVPDDWAYVFGDTKRGDGA